MANKQLLFSITKDHFDIQFFRAGGPGGQHQNKTSSACRIIHKESKAVGESRQERSQYANKKIAFKRLTKSKKFKDWLRIKAAAKIKGYQDIEAMIDDLMQDKYLKIEIKDKHNKWVTGELTSED